PSLYSLVFSSWRREQGWVIAVRKRHPELENSGKIAQADVNAIEALAGTKLILKRSGSVRRHWAGRRNRSAVQRLNHKARSNRGRNTALHREGLTCVSDY